LPVSAAAYRMHNFDPIAGCKHPLLMLAARHDLAIELKRQATLTQPQRLDQLGCAGVVGNLPGFAIYDNLHPTSVSSGASIKASILHVASGQRSRVRSDGPARAEFKAMAVKVSNAA
jgi:uncharacterized protein YceH (UPF0502 family)